VRVWFFCYRLSSLYSRSARRGGYRFLFICSGGVVFGEQLFLLFEAGDRVGFSPCFIRAVVRMELS
jgi:hypothetical protein